MPDEDRAVPALNSISPLLAHPYSKMPEHGSLRPQGAKSGFSVLVIGSYIFDWAILVVVGIIGVVLGNVTPNKRPFSLQDPNIS